MTTPSEFQDRNARKIETLYRITDNISLIDEFLSHVPEGELSKLFFHTEKIIIEHVQKG